MKKNKGRKLVALLLAALIVSSSSSALVYATDPNNDNTSTSSSEKTNSDKLVELLDYIGTLDSSKYTEDSWNEFMETFSTHKAQGF